MTPLLSFRNGVIAFAFACIALFAVALLWPHHGPDTHALHVAQQTTTQRIAVKDSVQARVKVAHARTSIRVKRLAPLRERVVLTPSGGATVDGDTVASVPGVRVLAQVIATQDTVIQALQSESAVKDTAIIAGDSALAASQREAKIAEAMLPSRWQRVQTAARWSVIGAASALLLHAVLSR